MDIPDIQAKLEEVKNHENDPRWLATAIVELSSMLYWHNTQVANAERDEASSLIGYLDQKSAEGEKRMSVAEAERRAIIATDNEYKKLKGQADAIVEVINSIKKKIDQLGWEVKNNI